MITIEIKEKKKIGRPKKEGFDKRIYNIKFQKENYERLSLTFNHRYDADIIAHLEKQEKKQTYLKALIRSDINK